MKICCGIILAVVLTGCARRAPNTGPVPQPNPQPKVATGVKDRVADMHKLVGELSELAKKLPAGDDESQRAVMRDVFDRMARALPSFAGPGASGQFRLQQRIVADARDQLEKNGNRLAQEPVTDSGMRAVYNAMIEVAQQSFYTSENITGDVTELKTRVDALDQVRGPMHRLATARAVQQAVALMDRMATIYDKRLARKQTGEAEPLPKRESEQKVSQ